MEQKTIENFKATELDPQLVSIQCIDFNAAMPVYTSCGSGLGSGWLGGLIIGHSSFIARFTDSNLAQSDCNQGSLSSDNC